MISNPEKCAGSVFSPIIQKQIDLAYTSTICKAFRSKTFIVGRIVGIVIIAGGGDVHEIRVSSRVRFVVVVFTTEIVVVVEVVAASRRRSRRVPGDFVSEVVLKFTELARVSAFFVVADFFFFFSVVVVVVVVVVAVMIRTPHLAKLHLFLL